MGRPQTIRKSLPGLWRVGRRFWPYLRRTRLLVTGSSVALVAAIGLRLLEPWPLKFVFDRVIGAASSGIPIIDALDPMALLSLAALAVVLTTGLRALADYSHTVGFARVGNRALADVRDEVYRHLQGLSLSFHATARSGDLVVRVISDINLLKDAVVTAVVPLLVNVLVLVSMVGLMWWLQWQLTLLALAMLPLFWLATTRLSRRLQEVSRQQRHREGALAATATEAIVAIKAVQALSLEGRFARDFCAGGARSEREDVKARRLAASLERSVDVLIAIATALVLWQGARLVLDQAMTPGDLLVFLTYLRRTFNPLQDFAKQVGRLARATAAGERILDLLETTPAVRDLPGAVPAPRFRGSVEFEAVTFGYDPDRPVLTQVDFLVRPGQRVAIVGPSGIGKSTLTSLLLRLYDPVQGSVRIDGRDVREYTLRSLRSQFGVVLEDTVLFAASALDNIGFGADDATREEIVAAARLANAHGFIEALPHGYDTLLGERGATLSRGQRQRIAIARAAVRNAPILILDEPTSGLDEANEREVITALDRLARGRTTFLIQHDLHLAARADVILYLDHGRLSECGTHTELLRANGLYAAAVRLQSTSPNGGLVASAHAVTA
jgi:ATP-binding cassette subfamily B protein